MNLATADGEMVLATIWHKSGYSPDNVGARLLVTHDAVHGSMNTGRRRKEIADSARACMNRKLTGAVAQYPLGNILGTGNGSYEVVFSVFQCGGNLPDWLVKAFQLQQEGKRFVLSQTIETHADNVLSDFRVITPDIADSDPLTQRAQSMLANGLAPDSSSRIHTGHLTTLLQVVGEPQLNVGVIGSGEMTKSLIAQLSLLPVSVQWLAPGFNADSERSVAKAPLSPEALEKLPGRTRLVIATGDHELDYQYCKQALLSNRFTYVGCIGSAKKADLIKARLAQRKIASDQLIIPVGLPSIDGKQPAIVAASIVAQLLSFKDNSTSAGKIQSNEETGSIRQ